MGRSYPHFLLWVNYFLFCQISYAILASDGRRALSRGLGWLWRCRLGLCGVRRGRRCRSIGLSRHLSGANAHGKPNGKLSVGGASQTQGLSRRQAVSRVPARGFGPFLARANRDSAALCPWAPDKAKQKNAKSKKLFHKSAPQAPSCLEGAFFCFKNPDRFFFKKTVFQTPELRYPNLATTADLLKITGNNFFRSEAFALLAAFHGLEKMPLRTPLMQRGDLFSCVVGFKKRRGQT